MPIGVPKELGTLFASAYGERQEFLSLAERVSFLTLPFINPDPGLRDRSTTYSNVVQRIPFNTYGASAVKGLTASLSQTLNPPGIKFYKLDTSPELTLNDAQQAELDKFFRREEMRIAEWLANNHFTAFSDVAIERNLIEGTNGVRIHPTEGLTLYKCRNLSISRRGKNVHWIVFQGFIDKPVSEDTGAMESIAVYTFVNKRTGDIWTQREDEKEPIQVAGTYFDEELGELIEIESDEDPKYWFVFGTEIPQFNNYAQAFYMNYLSLLEEIEDSSRSLKNAKHIAGQFFYTMSPTGVGEITPQRFARIRNNEVVPMEHDKVRPWSAGAKIETWEWLSRKLNEDGQRLLNISAVGIFSRRAGVKTATEIRAIRAELETLIGSTANVLSQTFHFQIVDAVIEILGIRKRLAEDPALEGIDKETMNKLVRGSVVTGSPEVARERELEKLQDATEHNLAMFGDRAAEQINVRGYMDTIYDSLGLNTENVLISEEVVAERQEAAAAEAAEAQQAAQAAPLPGPNGQLNQNRQQLGELRAGGVL